MPATILGYQVHIANVGWAQGYVYDGMGAGTTGQSLSVQAIIINGLPPTFQYRAHVGNIGWMDWVNPGEVAGTVGRGLGLQALQFRNTTGDQVPLIIGRAHVGFIGWMPVMSGMEPDFFGTTGRGLDIQAIQLLLVLPNEAPTRAFLSEAQAEVLQPGFDAAAPGLPNPIAMGVVAFGAVACGASINNAGVVCAGLGAPGCLAAGIVCAAACTTMVLGGMLLVPAPAPVPAPPGDEDEDADEDEDEDEDEDGDENGGDGD